MDITRSTKQIFIVALASAALLFAGCAKKMEVASTASAKPVAHTQTVQPVSAPVVPKPSSHSVYFAFNVAELDRASGAILDQNAVWLNANPSVKITIEGNCDQRGTREYNMALGQRRADRARAYLVSKGVSAARIDTISFGKERPVCKGAGEACWAQNRRDDIVVR